jgi:hypothetical protein
MVSSVKEYLNILASHNIFVDFSIKFDLINANKIFLMS